MSCDPQPRKSEATFLPGAAPVHSWPIDTGIFGISGALLAPITQPVRALTAPVLQPMVTWSHYRSPEVYQVAQGAASHLSGGGGDGSGGQGGAAGGLGAAGIVIAARAGCAAAADAAAVAGVADGGGACTAQQHSNNGCMP